MKIKKDFLLRKITSTRVGGPASFYVEAVSETEFGQAINWARERKLKWAVIGDGTNLIPNDGGFGGLVIRIKIEKFDVHGNKVWLGAGNNLLGSIRRLNKLGFGGMEKMAGIPGTVGGAIYGCAGAYGQEIKDRLVKVKIMPVDNLSELNSDRLSTGGNGRWLVREQCHFSYRNSVFKKQPRWIIIEAELRLAKGDPKLLQKTSREIIQTRNKKYPPGLLCPGSFFKNIPVNSIKPASLKKKLLAKIQENRVLHGKIPAAYLLELVGAKGMRFGRIAVADYHANLLYNLGGGKAADIMKLAAFLKRKVKQKFGITLEEEVRYF